MPEDNAPTHIAFVKKHYTKKLFVWLEVGKGRLDNKGHFHGMLDRLPIGGFSTGVVIQDGRVVARSSGGPKTCASLPVLQGAILGR